LASGCARSVQDRSRDSAQTV